MENEGEQVAEMRADIRHIYTRLDGIEKRMDKNAETATNFREKQIEILERLSQAISDVKELRSATKRIYIFCALLAGAVGGGVEVFGKLFF